MSKKNHTPAGFSLSRVGKTLLCCLLLFPYLFMLSLPLYLYWHQHQMKQKLQQEVMVFLQIPEEELVWLKPNKEIFVNNRYFDIKTIVWNESAQKYDISGLYDDDEKRIKKQLKEWWSEDSDHQSSSPSSQKSPTGSKHNWGKFLSTCTLLPTHSWNNPPPHNVGGITAHPAEDFSSKRPVNAYLPVLGKPPESVSYSCSL